MGARNGKVLAWDAQSGKARWAFQTGATIGSFGPYQWGGSLVMGAPCIDGDRVCAGSNDGRVYVLDVHTGRELWSCDLGVPVTSSPAVAGDMLYVATFDGSVFAFECSEPTWGPELPEDFAMNPSR